MAGDRQGPCHRMAVGLDKSTERNLDRWRCSVVVRACRGEGTTRKKARRKKNKNANNTPQHHKPTCSFGSGTSHSGFTRFNPVELGRGAVEPLNRG